MFSIYLFRFLICSHIKMGFHSLCTYIPIYSLNIFMQFLAGEFNLGKLSFYWLLFFFVMTVTSHKRLKNARFGSQIAVVLDCILSFLWFLCSYRMFSLFLSCYTVLRICSLTSQIRKASTSCCLGGAQLGTELS